MSLSSQTISPISPHKPITNISKKITIDIPGSKSHTIRALLLTSIIKGTTTINNLLYSGDTKSCIDVIKNWGVETTLHNSNNNIGLTVKSPGLLALSPKQKIINVGNSGTTLFFALALAALMKHKITFDGDTSLRTRSAKPLLDALTKLGATISDTNNGCLPLTIQGPISNGSVHIDCPTSQYASALLYTLSCINKKSTIYPTLAGEHPYIDMTLVWLSKYGADITNDNYTCLTINKGINLNNCKDNPHPSHVYIAGDYSSAAFFLVAAAITNTSFCIDGLIPNDTQADAQVLDILTAMGCTYNWHTKNNCNYLVINPPHTGFLKGGKFDLSQTPDSLPILAIAACYANSEVTLYNVAHARKKETDRIAVMAQELSQLGIHLVEKQDGLTIYPNKPLHGGTVQSHKDHRIAMAFAIGALAAQGPITIKNADVAAITFPTFYQNLEKLMGTPKSL